MIADLWCCVGIYFIDFKFIFSIEETMKSDRLSFWPIYRQFFNISIFCRPLHTFDMIKHYVEPIYDRLFPPF